MSDQKNLPTIFAQGTEQNDRISSLLSSVYFRGIRPSFTPAIRNHPLSMWTLDISNEQDIQKRRRHQTPVVLFLEAANSEKEYMKIIATVLKKAAAESGLVVAERTCKVDDSGLKDILGTFSSEACVFVMDLCSGADLSLVSHHDTRGEHSCIKGILSLDPSSKNARGASPSIPRLVLLSKDTDKNEATSTTFNPAIQCHLGDPFTTALVLPEPLSTYGDDGAKSLWIARTALKWMKAVVQTSSHVPLVIQSRL